MLPTLTAQIQTASGEEDAQGWKAAPLMLSRKSGGSSTPLCKGEGSYVHAHFLQFPILGQGISAYTNPLQFPYGLIQSGASQGLG